MKRVIVIGCPGSGKSVFAKALHQKTGIPLFHLDNLYWNADQTTVDRDVFIQRLTDVLEKPEWIIDGNYLSTMEWRLQHCDTVFFLDIAAEVCLDGVQSRMGKPRSDLPWIETQEDAEFMAFIRNFSKESRPEILALLAQHSDKTVHIFHNRKEANAFLGRAVSQT